MITITTDMTINDVVKKYPETLKVFSEFKVDSCCGGAESIATTAAVSNANIPELMKALNKTANKET